MKQQRLTVVAGFERFDRQTRRAEFLSLIEPHYAKGGNGRPPTGLERMLRIYFLQQWFRISQQQSKGEAADTERDGSFAEMLGKNFGSPHDSSDSDCLN
jgi:hypothetical protein